MVRVTRVSTALMALVAISSSGARAEEGSNISLSVGAQKVITVPGISRIAVGDPSVADVKTVGNDQVLIIGTGEGKTSLLIWKGSGQRVSYAVAVRRQDPNEVISEIRKLLGDIEGVSIRTVGDRVVIDGQVYTSQDSDRIEQVMGLYPNVKSFVRVAPNAKKLAAQNLTAAFQRAGLRSIQASVVGSTIFLEGAVESQQELQKADLITRAMGEKVENLLVVGIRRMILSEVQFVEVRRNSTDRFGIKYPTDISGSATAQVVISKELSPTTATHGALPVTAAGQSDFSIGFQANEGSGRLLAQPTLVCASGEKAEFLAGGEVPIPLITSNQYTVEYKPYGIMLRIRPTADRDANIQMEIEAEASEIDTSAAVSFGGSSAIPGFRTRKVKTNVTVRHGETIVLSGVFSDDQQKAVSKVPGLGNIPIIGELFKNRALDGTQRELVIFITPRIVGPDSDEVRRRIGDVRERYDKAHGEVSFSIFD